MHIYYIAQSFNDNIYFLVNVYTSNLKVLWEIEIQTGIKCKQFKCFVAPIFTSIRMWA